MNRSPAQTSEVAVSDPPLKPSVLMSMLGPGVAVATARPIPVEDQLFPDERQHIARAVVKRKAEFGTARLCARRALAELGIAPCSLVPRGDRSPRWPPGVKGSISHTKDCCLVAVTRAPEVIGLGIDVEEDVPLRPELIANVCTPDEQRWLDGFDQEAKGRLGMLIFSAKESFYKCQYDTTRTFIEFHDVQLSVDLSAGEFSVAKIRPEGPQWNRVRRAAGKFKRAAGFIVTTTLLTAP